jgi:deoxycytidylate deaminase
MKNIKKYLEICENIANKSNVICSQHGACLVYRGKIISMAYNTYTKNTKLGSNDYLINKSMFFHISC